MRNRVLVVGGLGLAQVLFAVDRIAAPAPLSRPLPAMSPVGADVTYPVSVTVAFIVDDAGATRDACVTRSTHRAFEATAVETVLRWRFKPAVREGKPVFAHLTTQLVFRADRVEIADDDRKVASH